MRQSGNLRAQSYRPFLRPTDFEIYRKNDGSAERIRNIRKGYSLAIRPNGFIPRTGILLCQYLNTLKLNESFVLDVGTGESALIAIHCAILGATRVEAIDVDKVAIEWAQKNLVTNNLTSKIELIKKSLCSYRSAIKFDFIVSNPPQMPIKENRSIHDDAGQDGKFYLRGLIKLASHHLKPGGVLIFAAFDFLGIDTAYNRQLPVFQILKRNYFIPRIVRRVEREIRPDSRTARNLRWIKGIYPGYIFKRGANSHYYHKVLIVSARKVAST